MYSLTIVFGAATPVMWTLLFQDGTRAKEIHDYVLEAKKKNAGLVGIVDDFSQEVTIDIQSMSGFMLEDMDRSQLGQIEKALHDRRAQVKFEALVNSDPGLRQQQRQPSMPILQPMGNGFRPVS